MILALIMNIVIIVVLILVMIMIYDFEMYSVNTIFEWPTSRTLASPTAPGKLTPWSRRGGITKPDIEIPLAHKPLQALQTPQTLQTLQALQTLQTLTLNPKPKPKTLNPCPPPAPPPQTQCCVYPTRKKRGKGHCNHERREHDFVGPKTSLKPAFEAGCSEISRKRHRLDLHKLANLTRQTVGTEVEKAIESSSRHPDGGVPRLANTEPQDISLGSRLSASSSQQSLESRMCFGSL